MELRPYQEEAIHAVESALSRGIRRQLIQLPTGCGKTVIFCSVLSQMNLPCMVIAHRQELLSQAKETALKWKSTQNPKIYGEEPIADSSLLISSIQLATQPKRLEFLKQFSPKVIVFDEAHHAPASSYRLLLDELDFDSNGVLLLGVSATPTRLDGLGMNNVFTDLVYSKNIVDMIELGYLCPVKADLIRTGIDLSQFDDKPLFYKDKTTLPESYDHGAAQEKDLNDKAVAAAIDTDRRNEIIVKSYIERCCDRKHTMAFCADVNHSISLAKMFEAHGVPAKASFGSMSQETRSENLQLFRDGKIKVLTNCNLYTEGFDFPALDCILMTRPTKSKALYTQCVGRGTRKYPGKNDCYVLDFRDDIKALICTFADMDDRPKRENPYEEKDPDAEEQVSQKEVKKSDGTVYYQDLDLFQNVSEKQRLPVTQLQINQLTKAYPNRTFDFESMKRKEASELIGNLQPTSAQNWLLKNKKYPKIDSLTKWDASKIIAKIKEGKEFCPTCGGFAYNNQSEWCDDCDYENESSLQYSELCKNCGENIVEEYEIYCYNCNYLLD